MKFEVPTDAPKDLYYRCAVSGHGAMGNAAFVMEATEPPPVKVGYLPALKTSTWNDRDFAGIGTNKSVMVFNDNDENFYRDLREFLSQPLNKIEILWKKKKSAREDMIRDYFSSHESGGAGKRAAQIILKEYLI